MAKAKVSDPGRLLGLLWEPPERAGRSGLSVPRIVDATIELADAEGIGAVTIRAVAERLGTGAMSLYTHVPGKPELLELMVDRVAADTYAGRAIPAEQPTWQDGVRHIARSNWDNIVAHPWTTDIPSGRPVLGPGICDKYELELAPLADIGMSDVEVDLTLAAVLGLANSTAERQIGLDRVRRISGQDDPSWWETMGPLLAATAGGRDYPLSGRIGTAASIEYNATEDPLRTLTHGVELLIRGIEQQLEK